MFIENNFFETTSKTFGRFHIFEWKHKCQNSGAFFKYEGVNLCLALVPDSAFYNWMEGSLVQRVDFSHSGM